MIISSHGYCLIGFEIKDEDICKVEALGLHCTMCDQPRAGKFCQECGHSLRPKVQLTFKPEAYELAKYLSLELNEESAPYWYETFEDFCHQPPAYDEKGVPFFGIPLKEEEHINRAAVEKAFAKAEHIRDTLNLDRDITLRWGHYLS